MLVLSVEIDGLILNFHIGSQNVLFKDIEVGQVWKITDNLYPNTSFRYLLILEIRNTKNRMHQTVWCADGIILYSDQDTLTMKRDTWSKAEIEDNKYFAWERIS